MGDKKKQLEDLLLDKTFEYLQYARATNDKHEYLYVDDQNSTNRFNEIQFIKDIYETVSKHPDTSVKTEIEYAEPILLKVQKELKEQLNKCVMRYSDGLDEHKKGLVNGKIQQAQIAVDILNKYL